MTSLRSGGCLCGAIHYEISAEPVLQAICHCRHCQKQAGSAFSIIIGVPSAALIVKGHPKRYHDTAESGLAVIREFCGHCGSPLFSHAAGTPGLVFVKAGTLDQTDDFRPEVQVWVRSRQAWVEAGDIPEFETVPQG